MLLSAVTERVLSTPVSYTHLVVVAKVKGSKAGVGFNAATEKYVDMMTEGIVDPTKVTRSALQNAASASAMLLTTEACVVEIKSDNPCLLYTS